jgi:AcrR family transcriptional regulator
MSEAVNPRPMTLRQAQTSQTEARILSAASELFLARGYLATTLADVADHAGVAARTVYVRFGTKAAVLARVVDVAIAGDTAFVPLLERPDLQGPFTGPDAHRRVVEFCHIGAQIMRRTGDLFAVAQEAALLEPEIQAKWQAGREGTRRSHRILWHRLADDRLLDTSVDLRWLVDTTTLLGGAETFLLARRLYRWTIPAYERWLVASYLRLAQLG